MAINEKIIGVTASNYGTYMNLASIDTQREWSMEILDPPELMELQHFIGQTAWSCGETLMVGDSDVGKRIGCCAVKLHETRYLPTDKNREADL